MFFHPQSLLTCYAYENVRWNCLWTKLCAMPWRGDGGGVKGQLHSLTSALDVGHVPAALAEGKMRRYALDRRLWGRESLLLPGTKSWFLGRLPGTVVAISTETSQLQTLYVQELCILYTKPSEPHEYLSFSPQRIGSSAVSWRLPFISFPANQPPLCHDAFLSYPSPLIIRRCVMTPSFHILPS
jgi:hypothetical protein